MAASYQKYAPTDFSQIILPSHIKNELEGMRAKKVIEPMLFYGKPGCGKTLTASLMQEDALLIRCNSENSPSSILSLADRAAKTANVQYPDLPRLIIFDEIDCLSKRNQNNVRALIDDTLGVTAFIATTNHLDALVAPLISRLQPRCFDVDKRNLTVRQDWKARLAWIYRAENGVDAEPQVIENALRAFPDARNMVSTVLTGYLVQ